MADIENSDEVVNPPGNVAGGDGGGNVPPSSGGSPRLCLVHCPMFVMV